ncbi:hypothetical protein AJ80_02487 [Polytolypa hystricis UAMH7299]|uniref:arginyltransferase n=1 Tax=Polytolypa hystricis (strain UAMH7299) TaxID=1447883 RepID=A0A2B7YRB8_POLH7|nr:hypothetical protein AJ80_02487 [Polytolypa hystricis UAMH7299]
MATNPLYELQPGKLSFFIPRGVAYYASSTSSRVEEYEELVNRGWRRSGTLYYKQNLKRSCCPHYTIRLDPTAFKPRRDQKKAINRWNNFILGPEYMRKAARLCPKTREQKKHRKQTFNLLAQVHEAEYSNVNRPIDPTTKRNIEPAHKFEVNIESDSFSLAKFNVFLKYQKAVHNEPADRWNQSSFKRFLCTGISQKAVRDSDGKNEQKLGSYHQCYRLDGQLVAVAVLDLLPHGVSSVYIFYDPDYEQWEFGKLSAMREIAMTLEGGYQHYYMGFYIHSCPKMRYKATFQPQYILDPETYTWDLLDDEVCKKLDKRRYVSLSHDRRAALEKGGSLEDSGPPPGTTEELSFPGEEEMSLFDIHMPGVMTIEEIQTQLDLDHWRLLVAGTLVEMMDLVAWEDSNIRDPQAIKGIMAELAAVLGPKVVENSAVLMFES